MSTQTPAGWYVDPTTSGQLRWWDGTQWTHNVQPRNAPPPPTTQDSTAVLNPTGDADTGHYPSPPDGGRHWWQRKRVLVPAGLLLVLGIGGALVADSEQTPEIRTDEIQELVDLEPAGSSDSQPDQSSSTELPDSTSTTTALSTSTTSTTSVASSTSTTVATSATTTTTGASTTTAPPTTAETTTTVPTTAPSTTAAPTTLGNSVTPGAFCQTEGTTGKSPKGLAMVCASTKKDGTPYGEGRLRWRSP